MIRRFISASLLVLVTAAGTIPTLPQAASPAAVHATTPLAGTLPAAPAQGSVPARALLSAPEMSQARGEGIFGWLKKIWKKFKKTIIKVVFTVIQEIINAIISSETTSQVEGITGQVSETYEATDATQVTYASQSAYEANQVQSTSYSEGAYSLTFIDRSLEY